MMQPSQFDMQGSYHGVALAPSGGPLPRNWQPGTPIPPMGTSMPQHVSSMSDDDMMAYAKWMGGQGPMPRSWRPGMPVPGQQVYQAQDPSVQTSWNATAGQQRSFPEIQAQRDASFVDMDSILDHGRMLAEQNPDIASDIRAKAAALAMPYGMENRRQELAWDAEHTRSLAVSTDPGGAEKFRRYQAGELKGYELLGDPGVSPHWKNLVAQDALNNPNAGRREMPQRDNRPEPRYRHLDAGMKRALRQSGMSQMLIDAYDKYKSDQRQYLRGRPVNSVEEETNRKQFDMIMEETASRIAKNGGLNGETDQSAIEDMITVALETPAPSSRRGGKSDLQRDAEHVSRQVAAAQKVANRILERGGRRGRKLQGLLDEFDNAMLHGTSQDQAAIRTKIENELPELSRLQGKLRGRVGDKTAADGFSDSFFKAVTDHVSSRHREHQQRDPAGYALFEEIKSGKPLDPRSLQNVSEFWKKQIAEQLRRRGGTP